MQQMVIKGLDFRIPYRTELVFRHDDQILKGVDLNVLSERSI